MSTVEDLFHPVVELPEPIRADRYRRLIGVDHLKYQLSREAQLLAHPGLLRAWAAEHHPAGLPALALFTDRSPLFLFAGDVGCGKTALAESFGCDLAESLDLPVFLYRLKLTARGSGLVGEMTTLTGDAYSYLLTQGRKARGGSQPGSVFILVVDEADALAQSRAAEQMHHEDRAGVDALLAGVDSLAGEAVPVIVIMCTNRERALDPAVLRRAAAIFHFSRPDEAQRHAVLADALAGTGIDTEAVSKLAVLTGPAGGRPGFTYSDLTQRLIPAAILTAFPDKPLTADILLAVAASTDATPEFRQAP
ncbi:MAG TPA: AAA family ATPase [Streptosporangiaceae bacterium]|nr:AAA family ATPase [Streptosporangiaceae bacterium]